MFQTIKLRNLVTLSLLMSCTVVGMDNVALDVDNVNKQAPTREQLQVVRSTLKGFPRGERHLVTEFLTIHYNDTINSDNINSVENDLKEISNGSHACYNEYKNSPFASTLKKVMGRLKPRSRALIALEIQKHSKELQVPMLIALCGLYKDQLNAWDDVNNIISEIPDAVCVAQYFMCVAKKVAEKRVLSKNTEAQAKKAVEIKFYNSLEYGSERTSEEALESNKKQDCLLIAGGAEIDNDDADDFQRLSNELIDGQQIENVAETGNDNSSKPVQRGWLWWGQGH